MTDKNSYLEFYNTYTIPSIRCITCGNTFSDITFQVTEICRYDGKTRMIDYVYSPDKILCPNGCKIIIKKDNGIIHMRTYLKPDLSYLKLDTNFQLPILVNY